MISEVRVLPSVGRKRSEEVCVYVRGRERHRRNLVSNSMLPMKASTTTTPPSLLLQPSPPFYKAHYHQQNEAQLEAAAAWLPKSLFYKLAGL